MSERIESNGGHGRAGCSGAPSAAAGKEGGPGNGPGAEQSGPIARPVTPAGAETEPIADKMDWGKVEEALADLREAARRCKMGESR